jgi:Fur family ferric uptake transcriptional regulator
MPAVAKERFREFLRTQELRMTSDREAIVEAVFSTEEHFGAEELAWRLRERGVSKATIYRTLPLLVGCGLLRQVIFGDKHGHYEHVHEEDAGHDHLICTRCGGIIEFQHPCVGRVREAVRRRYGFEPERVVLEISGRCAGCRQREGI